MTLSELHKELSEFLKTHPKLGELPVIYIGNNEDNPAQLSFKGFEDSDTSIFIPDDLTLKQRDLIVAAKVLEIPLPYLSSIG